MRSYKISLKVAVGILQSTFSFRLPQAALSLRRNSGSHPHRVRISRLHHRQCSSTSSSSLCFWRSSMLLARRRPRWLLVLSSPRTGLASLLPVFSSRPIIPNLLTRCATYESFLVTLTHMPLLLRPSVMASTTLFASVRTPLSRKPPLPSSSRS